MAKRLTIVILILLIIFGGTFSFDLVRSHMIKKFFAHFKVPPVAVATRVAKVETWQQTLTSVGTLQAVNGVEVNSQVNGQIEEIYFKSGEFVNKGQPLVQLDDSIDQQTLKDDQAQLQLATLTYQRQLEVYKTTQGASKSEVDTAKAKMLQMQAAVETAMLNIQYKKIVAPFAGKVGIRQINLGQYITAGSPLISLQSLDPLFVDFSLTQQQISSVAVGQKVVLNIDGFPGETFTGTISALNSIVSRDTRSLQARATVPNQQMKLYPGIFANVTVLLPTEQNVIVVPQTAITYSLYGDSIFVVEKKPTKDNKNKLIASQRFVKVGESKNDMIAVVDGVKPGDEVIVSGQVKLHNGSEIVVNNAQGPKF